MKWIPLLLLLTAALAGCSSDDAESPDSGTETTSTSTSGTSTTTATKTSTQTTTAGPGPNQTEPNRPPTANLTANVTTGEAPLTVAFAVDGTDPDGDRLGWTLDVNADGEAEGSGNAIPSEYSHTFSEAGQFLVRLTVTDGNLSANATLVIEVLPATEPEPEGPTQEFSGSFVTGTPVECQYGFFATLDGISFVGTAVVPESVGLPYTATFDSVAPSAFYGVSWFDAGGNWLGDHSGDPAGSSISGTVPGGAAQVYFWSCAGGYEVDVHYLVP